MCRGLSLSFIPMPMEVEAVRECFGNLSLFDCVDTPLVVFHLSFRYMHHSLIETWDLITYDNCHQNSTNSSFVLRGSATIEDESKFWCQADYPALFDTCLDRHAFEHVTAWRYNEREPSMQSWTSVCSCTTNIPNTRSGNATPLATTLWIMTDWTGVASQAFKRSILTQRSVSASTGKILTVWRISGIGTFVNNILKTVDSKLELLISLCRASWWHQYCS